MPQEQINLLIYMLDDVRRVTLKGISGLTKEQLFQEPVPGEFCIGSYLMHLGECDLGWLSAISGKEQPDAIKKRVYFSSWYDCGKEEFNPPKEAPEPQEYINAVTEARELLRNYILSLNDTDLETEIIRKNERGERKFKKKWIIYHLIEHEAHTRGQMFLLIRMAGFKKKGENN